MHNNTEYTKANEILAQESTQPDATAFALLAVAREFRIANLIAAEAAQMILPTGDEQRASKASTVGFPMRRTRGATF